MFHFIVDHLTVKTNGLFFPPAYAQRAVDYLQAYQRKEEQAAA